MAAIKNEDDNKKKPPQQQLKIAVMGIQRRIGVTTTANLLHTQHPEWQVDDRGMEHNDLQGYDQIYVVRRGQPGQIEPIVAMLEERYHGVPIMQWINRD
jgi:hypothetical protein